MDLFNLAERGMGMTEDTWMRHANPLSVWTRFTCLPLLILAIWSRIWLGWWALGLVALAMLWTWVNPRAFPVPENTDNWASKGTFGERVFLNRRNIPIPAHHRRWAFALGALSAIGLPPLVWGVWQLDVAITVLGTVLVVLPKVWFVDRMVWLYEDMKDASPDYAAWLR
ncbi:MAG: hypothetical protein HKN18_06265 [Silicimonas sp.]|nr:hypothetical protein [Silicimonas sp.]